MLHKLWILSPCVNSYSSRQLIWWDSNSKCWPEWVEAEISAKTFQCSVFQIANYCIFAGILRITSIYVYLKSHPGISVQFSSVQSLTRVQLFATPWLQHARPPCPSPTPGVYSNSCPSSRWCHPAISSSVVPFSSCPQSLLASGSFPRSQLLLLATFKYILQ